VVVVPLKKLVRDRLIRRLRKDAYPGFLTSASQQTINQNAASTLLSFAANLDDDLQVTCKDLEIVKASFGTKTGQSGFNPMADVNGDGIVNVLDLSTVARQLPVGTTCP
jgi:hypothetical protein